MGHGKTIPLSHMYIKKYQENQEFWLNIGSKLELYEKGIKDEPLLSDRCFI